MKLNNLIIFLVNLCFFVLLIYFWFFWTGHIKTSGGLRWHLIIALLGTLFGIISIVKSKSLWMENRKYINLLNFLIPFLFIGFHVFWIIYVGFRIVVS
jgi:hypothetical protein